MNERNKSTITQDLQTLISKSQAGESIPTELLQRIFSFDTYQIMNHIIHEATVSHTQNQSPNNYLLSQIRLVAIKLGKALTTDQEIDLVLKIRAKEITSLADELSNDKYANITPERDNSQPNRNSSDMGGR